MFSLLVLLLPAISHATVAQKMDVSSLTQEADFVGMGRVVNLENIVINGQSWTVASVTVEKGLKGRSNSTVRIRIPGGQQLINGRVLVTKVDGAPELNVNQRGVFFLNGKAGEDYSLTGLGQGCWRVQSRQGKEIATPSSDPDAPAFLLNKVVSDIEKASRLPKRTE